MTMKKTACVAAVAALAAAAAWADDISKWDPRMAAEKAVAGADGLKWIDGEYLPLEGKAFADVDHYYDRLPKNVTTNVNGGVRSMKHHTSGMMFRFKTTSPTVSVEWVPYGAGLSMDHMPATGVSGIDIYAEGDDGTWRYVKTGRIHGGPRGAWPTGRVDRVWIKPGTLAPQPVSLDAVKRRVYAAAPKNAYNLDKYYSGDPSHSYFVVFCGGQNAEMNHIFFWADTAMFYSTLTKKYKVPADHIRVLMSDGLSDEVDACLGEYSNGEPILVSSPTDLDGDGKPDLGAVSKLGSILGKK